jgi:hypothetical protein
MERAHLRYGCGVADTNHKRAAEWIGWGEHLPTQRRVVSEREGMGWKTYNPNSMKKALERFLEIKEKSELLDAKRREQRQRTLYTDPMTIRYK